jgi:hypothetical protein
MNLAEVYPGAPDAVAAHEVMVSEALWNMARQDMLSPVDVLGRLQGALDDTLLVCAREDVKTLTEIHRQTNHHNFLAWIKGKLGAM